MLQFHGTLAGDVLAETAETVRFSSDCRHVGMSMGLKESRTGCPHDEADMDFTGVPQGVCRESGAGNLNRTLAMSLPCSLSTRVTSVARAETFASSMSSSPEI
jgi:hypothetical protein